PRVLLVLPAGLAPAAAVGWTRRRSLAEWYLLGRAAALGLRDVRLHVASLDQHGIAIESIAIGAPAALDLTIERLDASWSWPSLEAGRFDAGGIADGLLGGGAGRAGPA